MKFSAVIVLFVASIISGAAASVETIDKDIDIIRQKADALRKSVQDFPVNGGGTIAQASVIRRDTADLKDGFDHGTKHVQATPPFSDADAHRFLEEIKKYAPTVVGFLKDVVARRRSFENVGGVDAVPYVLEGLKQLGNSASSFGDAMVKSDPQSVKPQAQKLKEELAAEFRKTIQEYSK